jgi:hypothetical protein
MSYAACTLHAYRSQDYLGPLKSDRVTLSVDAAFITTISVVCGLILGGIIPIDLPQGIIGYIHYATWAGIGVSAVMLVLDGVASLKNIPSDNLDKTNDSIEKSRPGKLPVEKNDVQANHPATSATKPTGHICMASEQTGGYIGHPTQRQLLPLHLNHITREDGSPLPLAPEDFFIQFHLFNMSQQLKDSGIPSEIYLPSALFKGKKDGDVIRLKYQNLLIELTIQQENHGLKFPKGTFEEVFPMQITRLKGSCDLDEPIFCMLDPYWFYKLGDQGAIYKLESDKSENNDSVYHLKDGVSADFRPKANPLRATVFKFSQSNDHLFLALDFSRFQPEDIDIILNDTHVIVYGENSLTLGTVDINHKKETLVAFRWDRMECFKGRSIEEMKTLMKKSQFALLIGVLQFMIPLH